MLPGLHRALQSTQATHRTQRRLPSQPRHQPTGLVHLGCGSAWDHYEEKETDVNIAVNLVQDAFKKAADDFLIISGDTDLAPAIKMARSAHDSMFVAAAFPPERFSKMLKDLMPASFTINENKIRAAQLPDTFTDGLTQKEYKRPPGWK
ncbi:NYN domain-containing protein [Paenarthrobacter ureafaciens]|uniref:NYN domain-containing protein n=1 Tax=Paenarthrobacter ureafaciens TaxID=37931 RepID=UPI001FB25DF4|nr:NYN domain-containing protein [Paenarthrobacter ureafaciens]UOD83141.1 NYN domain-containing protein [Paenarthrobacter ureafaciens]WNZ05960.1 NYN domain-containing protein [Paenarthrobacter ureafaciens]